MRGTLSIFVSLTGMESFSKHKQILAYRIVFCLDVFIVDGFISIMVNPEVRLVPRRGLIKNRTNFIICSQSGLEEESLCIFK